MRQHDAHAPPATPFSLLQVFHSFEPFELKSSSISCKALHPLSTIGCSPDSSNPEPCCCTVLCKRVSPLFFFCCSAAVPGRHVP